MNDRPQAVDDANRKLDQAVREYVTACTEAWGNEPAMVIGWTLGIGLTRFSADGEDDMLMIESAPGINNYLARGLADATAESFQAQASGWGEPDDD